MRSRHFVRPTIRHAAMAFAPLLPMSFAHTALAEEQIIPDRPGLVESSNVVGAGRFQLETGFTTERNKADSVRERLTTTPTLLRVGLNDTLEFRIETDGISRLRSEDTATRITTGESGYSDMAIGIKWHAQDGDAANGIPAMSLLLHADLETGSRAFRGDGVRPSLRVVAEWELPSAWSIGVMPGVFVEKNEGGGAASRPSQWANPGQTASTPSLNWLVSNWPPQETAATSPLGVLAPPT